MGLVPRETCSLLLGGGCRCCCQVSSSSHTKHNSDRPCCCCWEGDNNNNQRRSSFAYLAGSELISLVTFEGWAHSHSLRATASPASSGHPLPIRRSIQSTFSTWSGRLGRSLDWAPPIRSAGQTTTECARPIRLSALVFAFAYGSSAMRPAPDKV